MRQLQLVRLGPSWLRGWPSLVVALVLGSVASGPAVAQTPEQKQKCMNSYEVGQKLRAASKLRAAWDQLLVCSQEACPAALKGDCVQWLTEVERSIPTVVLSARDSAGKEIPSVRVMFDGEVLAESLSGAAIKVDPGQHVFKLQATTLGWVTEQNVFIRQGEKDRILAFTMGPTGGGVASPGVAPTSQPSTSPTPTSAVSTSDAESSSSKKTWGYIAGGVGLAALAAGTYFGLRASSKWKERNDNCPDGACNADAVSASDDAHTAARIADVAIGLGIVGVGVGTYLVLTAPSAPASTSSAMPNRFHGAMVSVGGLW